jgi:hypothetical protein
VYAVVTADRNVSSRELKRLIGACNEVFQALAIAYRDAPQVELDTNVQQRLGIEDWAKTLGDFNFVPPNQENISNWLNAVDSWLGATMGWLGSLRQATLEQLLISETLVATWTKSSSTAPEAPTPSKAPETYPTLTPGEERELQKRLDLWDKFQTADGFVAGTLRFIVAGSIVGGALFLTAAPQLLMNL